MENNLIRSLYKSRRRTKSGIVYKSDVVDVVEELIEAAEEKGLTVSRWQANSPNSSFVTYITWAAHEGERPERSNMIPDIYPRVHLSAVEGTTVKCAAYRELKKLLKRVRVWERQLPLEM